MNRYAIVLLTLLVACGSDPIKPSVSVVPLLSVVSGAGQVDTVAKELASPIALAVTNKATGLPLASYPINWVALDGGSVFAPITPSGLDGVARQRVTLGTKAGDQCFAARALDPETGDILENEIICEKALPGALVVSWAFTSAKPYEVHPGDVVSLLDFFAFFRDAYGNDIPREQVIAAATASSAWYSTLDDPVPTSATQSGWTTVVPDATTWRAPAICMWIQGQKGCGWDMKVVAGP